tara:strand:+ start:6520 stop:7104 length:585 start_codon:yes stop_codon:yes gene_type:complete
MIKITYYDVEQWVPNSLEGIGVWGWVSSTHNDRIRDRAEAEAKMLKDKSTWEEYLAEECERVTDSGSEEEKDHVAKLLANVKFRITEVVKNFTHASMYGWTDVHAYEIVKVVSDKTLEVRKMTTEHDISHLEQIAGGFCGHVVNQRNQKVTYESNPMSPVIRIRRKKNNPEAWTYNGKRFALETRPYAFYDYNF